MIVARQREHLGRQDGRRRARARFDIVLCGSDVWKRGRGLRTRFVGTTLFCSLRMDTFFRGSLVQQAGPRMHM